MKYVMKADLSCLDGVVRCAGDEIPEECVTDYMRRLDLVEEIQTVVEEQLLTEVSEPVEEQLLTEVSEPVEVEVEEELVAPAKEVKVTRTRRRKKKSQ